MDDVAILFHHPRMQSIRHRAALLLPSIIIVEGRRAAMARGVLRVDVHPSGMRLKYVVLDRVVPPVDFAVK